MNASLDSGNAKIAELEKIAETEFDECLEVAEALKGGRNSRVYRIALGDGREYVVKFYHQDPSNKRRCLETEFEAFRFLRDNGIDNVPRTVKAASNSGYAVFQFVSGTSFDARDIALSDVESSARFLGKLNALKNADGAKNLAPASEAFRSFDSLVESVEVRLSRFSAATKKNPKLERFLSSEFVPMFEEVVVWMDVFLKDAGLSRDEEIAASARTLSPSDFGFHNALKRKDGEIVYLDFEYFGWDDPAKTVSDFLLHPGMTINEELKQTFADRTRGIFGGDERFSARLEGAYPLFGLKWCLILLNEFLSSESGRRRFAADKNVGAELRAVQLAKSEKMLEKIKREFRNFPYSG